MFAYQRKCAGSARTNSTLSANRAPFPLPKSKRAEREGKRRRDESARKGDALGLAEETRLSLQQSPVRFLWCAEEHWWVGRRREKKT